MSVYDQAHELARELKNSVEYQEYLQVKSEIEADPSSKKMLIDIMRKQFELQTMQMMGQELDEAEVDKFRKMVEIVQLNRNIGRYIEMEQRIGTMLNDIQRILTEELEVGFKEIFEEEGMQ